MLCVDGVRVTLGVVGGGGRAGLFFWPFFGLTSFSFFEKLECFKNHLKFKNRDS